MESECTVNSVVLLSNGISFAIQVAIFFILGSFAGMFWSFMKIGAVLIEADFGTWRPNILIVLSLIAWGVGFGWLGVHDPSKWEVACGLYIVCRKMDEWSHTRELY
jgi:hypothetical protein